MLKLGLCCGGGLCCALLGGFLWFGGVTSVLDDRAAEANPLVTKAARLLPQSGQGEEIKAAFNANADRVRLMVLLSPT